MDIIKEIYNIKHSNKIPYKIGNRVKILKLDKGYESQANIGEVLAVSKIESNANCDYREDNLYCGKTSDKQCLYFGDKFCSGPGVWSCYCEVERIDY